MIVAFGTSTPTSITVVATSTSSSPALNAAMIERRSAGFSRPCRQPTRNPFSSARRSRSASSSAARADGRLRRLDQRADDVRLAAVREVAREPLVRLGAAVVGDPGGHDRLAVGGRRRDLGDRQVAVDRQRERARDRRRRHVEHVRAAPLGERGALLDAEAVLLVDDGDGEVAEADLLLDQRVRADRDLHVARRDQLAHVRVLLRAERAREERDAHAELACRCPRS